MSRAAVVSDTKTGARRRRLVPVTLLLLLSAATATPAAAADGLPPSTPDDDRPVVELALCLDTSGSMEPSIEAARIHLWGIVDDLARLEPTPRLRVALLTYGNIYNPAESGWVRIHTPLTEDLDAVSAILFDLKAGGSEEYVERVIRYALDRLDWSEAGDALRMVFVVGNEEADQDPAVDARDLALDARALDVAVHPVYVGAPAGRQFNTWRLLGETVGVQVATLRSGNRPQGPATPVDGELATLGAQLTGTYVPYGEEGEEAAENQKLQDDNVASLGLSVAASRAVTKAGPLYQGDWDLVDAVDTGRVALEDVPEEGLPADLRAMTPLEREDHLLELADRRRALRERIQTLAVQRERHLESKRVAGVTTQDDDLRTLVRRTIRERAEDAGIEF